MSLKDEVERLIESERRKLDELHKKSVASYERKRHRLLPLRAVLEEMVALNPDMISLIWSDTSATLAVRMGKTAENVVARWKIEPHYSCRFDQDKNKTIEHEEPGFFVYEEKFLYGSWEFDYWKLYPQGPAFQHPQRNDLHFPTEQEIAQYLMKEIAKWLALKRQLTAPQPSPIEKNEPQQDDLS